MLTREAIRRRLQDAHEKTNLLGGDHALNPGWDAPPHLKDAAVLIPLVERADGLTLLLTRRTDHLDHHPGQISFPGGHVDAGDATPTAAALRELEEETGIAAAHVEIAGLLDLYVTRTGFAITPVVGLLTPPFDVTPDAHEVAEVFEVPLDFLMDPAHHQRRSRPFEGRTRYYYAMPYRGYDIWGATAGMIKNLHSVLMEET